MFLVIPTISLYNYISVIIYICSLSLARESQNGGKLIEALADTEYCQLSHFDNAINIQKDVRCSMALKKHHRTLNQCI